MNTDINILKNSNDNNKLTIFVGAGVSKSSNLPSWGELINNIKKELSIDDNETDYLKIAQLYYLSCGEIVYFQKIKEYFPENIEATIIQKLIFDLKPAHIITTNWDILLEKTAENNGFIYDVISKDEHLVQSKLQNHIIKMHGDFRDNNIVFKEDDYINYKYNFPLIENYVKSILSTNTILFLGYSYSDINLKQITKWIQNNSKSMPPMFLVVFKEDKNQSKYLENFGIKTIILNEEKDFGLDSYSNKLATFLRYLNNPIEEFIDIDSMSEIDVVNFVYEKLKPLDKLNAILLRQIQRTLTNCGFIYEPTKDGNLILLEFYKEELTYDIDESSRSIYNRFKELFTRNDLSDETISIIHRIRSILYKANIDGIIVSDDFINSFPISKKDINYNERNLCNFNFDEFEVNENDIKALMKKAFLYYQKYEYLKAYKLNEKIILQCLRQKNYIQLFLVMFNKNVLLTRIKHPYYLKDTNEATKYEQAKNNMKLKPYDLDEKFYELPKSIQKVLKDIKPFLSYDYLYRFASDVDDEWNKKLKQKKSMEDNSSITLDTNITRNYSKQKNLISFVLNNFVMMERNDDFHIINKKLIQISLIRQMQKDYFILDKMELYATIKYIQNKELIDLLDDFKLELRISAQNINWMTNKLLPNIVSLFNQNKSLYSHFSDELKNIIYLLQKQQLNNFQSNIVLQQFKKLIDNSKINLDVYKQINNFIGNQNNIDSDELIDIIELIIHKFICDRASIWDNKVIEENHLYNPFKHLNNKNLYSNQLLIEKFLKELERYDEKQKIQISKGFVISLYYISKNEIKDLIKNFMLSINIDNINEDKLSDITNYGLKISFKLFLVINKLIDINEKIINEVKLYPEKEKDNLYFLGQITEQVRYLVEEFNIEELKELLNHLLKVIDEVNQRLKDKNSMMNII